MLPRELGGTGIFGYRARETEGEVCGATTHCDMSGHRRQMSRHITDGGGGIRTLVGGNSPETVFETAALETTGSPNLASPCGFRW